MLSRFTVKFLREMNDVEKSKIEMSKERGKIKMEKDRKTIGVEKTMDLRER